MKLTSYRPINKGQLLGSFDIHFDEWLGLTLKNLMLMQKDGKRWVCPPRKEYEKDGEKRWINLFKFEDKETWKRFEQKCISLIEDWCRDALTSEAQNRGQYSHPEEKLVMPDDGNQLF